MRVYTGTGDTGMTGLVGNERVHKTDLRIESVGAIDEVNASIGLARVAAAGSDLATTLEWLQSVLFDAGAEVASPDGMIVALHESQAVKLEQEMDRMQADLPELRTFVLPGGTELAARLHLARTITRRAERTLLRLHQADPLRSEFLVFFNRLSDWCFVAARYANHRAGESDLHWKKFDA